ncbi:MAG: FKBP-type peptidyl-prolyl cis-trans isomerase [Vicingaceae bacterium]
MKKVTLFAIAAVTLFACGTGGKTNSNVTLNNQVDSVSYAIGVNTANGIQTQFTEANKAALIKGLNDALDSADLLITTESVQGVIQTYFQKKQMEEAAKKQEEQAVMYESVKEEGIKFLEENKTKEGVQVTASGLQYIVMNEGTGKTPTTESTVTAHYVGMLPDGSVFESSVDNGKPIDFPVTGVIAGWTEGLQLMKEGAKYKFFIPQELAYGATPRQGGPIKPYQALVFEVELIKVN